jgi:TRAP-type C4-dicarboxylate transport system permease small subunit
VQTAAKFGLIALIALGLVLLPGGGEALSVVLTVLTIAFFAAIAMLGYRLYRENSFTLDSLEDRQRFVLYSSIGLAFLTFTATNRLFDQGGVGVLAWLVLLGLASYGVFSVWTHYRRFYG